MRLHVLFPGCKVFQVCNYCTSNTEVLHFFKVWYFDYCIDYAAGKTAWSTSLPEWPTLGAPVTVRKSCCSYHGVTCGDLSATSTNTSVLSIDLIALSLVGSLPSEIGLFKSMTNFSVGSNDIAGSIPSTIGDMTSLRYLDIGYNSLIGTIPSSIGALTSLEVLILFQNSLGGSIPASIGSLESLTVLFIDTNSLSGSIPATIGSISRLKVLSLYENKLTGTIPESVGNLNSVEAIFLSSNSLAGTIPQSMSNLLGLAVVELQINQLTGTIPHGFSQLTMLNGLYLWRNYLTMGSATTVPTTTFSQYTQDHTLDISENCLAYTSIQYPRQSTTATRCIRKLYEIVLSIMSWFYRVCVLLTCCSATQHIVMHCVVLHSLTSITLLISLLCMKQRYLGWPVDQPSFAPTSSPSSTGVPSNSIVPMSAPSESPISSSPSEAPVPASSASEAPVPAPSASPSSSPTSDPVALLLLLNEELACSALAHAFPQLQMLTGNIENCVHNHLHCMTSLQSYWFLQMMNGSLWTTGLPADKTAWSTSPPVWSGLRRLGEAIEEGSTHRGLFTTQPSCCSNYGVTCGSIPGTSSYASVLSIDLAYLGLSGSLPSEIGYFKSMTMLSMGTNYIVGSIPSTIGDMTSLRYLDIGYNSLVGTIPSTIGDLTSLRVLLLFDNRLSGTIPSALSSLTQLTDLYLNSNILKGRITEMIGSLKSLSVLSIFDNYLSGTIPASLVNLKPLTHLYLDYNSLTGTIPSSIFELTLLQYIHLSFNSLVGTIPNAVGQLKELQYLDMRNNSLTGTIPSSFSALQSLSILLLGSNHLTMGSAAAVPSSTFSVATQQGSLGLENNCLVYTSLTNPSQSTTATNCKILQWISNHLLPFPPPHSSTSSFSFFICPISSSLLMRLR